MAIITTVGIFGIFTNFFGYFGNSQASNLSWQLVAVNFLKSSPFLFLLYYTVHQYNKERRFQEAYAFKSAVALTIKAYADILKENGNKDDLILESVKNIYESPLSSKEKNQKDINSVADIVKDLSSSAKDISNATKELLNNK